MLDIDGGADVDARPQQLLHVLVTLDMAAALHVGVSQLVHQNELRMPRQRRVQVKFPQFHAVIWDDFDGELFQSLQQCLRFRPGVGLDISGHHVHTGGLSPVGGLQHCVGLAHARGIAEENLQPAAWLHVCLLDIPKQQIGIRTAIILHRMRSSLLWSPSYYLGIGIVATLLIKYGVRAKELFFFAHSQTFLLFVPIRRDAASIQKAAKAVYHKISDCCGKEKTTDQHKDFHTTPSQSINGLEYRFPYFYYKRKYLWVRFVFLVGD